MYRIDTSKGYSLTLIEQVDCAGLTQLPLSGGHFRRFGEAN
jgi:hypothetical protein